MSAKHVRLPSGGSSDVQTLLNTKSALPISLEHHCLSFCGAVEFGVLYLVSRSQRAIVARYLAQAHEFVITQLEPPPRGFELAFRTGLGAVLWHARSLRRLTACPAHVDELTAQLWLVAIVRRNATGLHYFGRNSRALSSPDLAYALASCKHLQTLRAPFPADFRLSEQQTAALIDALATHCPRLEDVWLSTMSDSNLGAFLSSGFRLKDLGVDALTFSALAHLAAPSLRGLLYLQCTLQMSYDAGVLAFTSFVRRLSEQLAQLPKLRSLWLQFPSGPARARSLAAGHDITFRLPVLEALTLVNHGTRPSGMPIVAAPKIARVEVDRLESAGLAAWLAHFGPSLQVLSLNPALESLEDAGPDLLAALGRGMLPGLVSLELMSLLMPPSFVDIVHQWTSLRLLHCLMPLSASTWRLVQLLRALPRLTGLVLTATVTGHQTAVVQDSALPAESSAAVVVHHHLELLRTNLVDAASLARLDLPVLRRVRLSPDGDVQLERVLSCMPRVGLLELVDCRATFSLASGAPTMLGVQVLRLDGVDLPAEQCAHLAAHCPNLKRIDVLQLTHTSKSLVVLALASQKLPQLEVCDLTAQDGLEPGSLAASTLTQLLLHAPKLHTLHLPPGCVHRKAAESAVQHASHLGQPCVLRQLTAGEIVLNLP